MGGNWWARSVGWVMVGICAAGTLAWAKALDAPPGMFKDLNEETVGNAPIIQGTQLFIDDYIIADLTGVKKVLNRPAKSPHNPLKVSWYPWKENSLSAGWVEILGNGTMMYDREEGIYKMWYHACKLKLKTIISDTFLCYATSKDGLHWQLPVINEKERNNVLPVSAWRGFSSGYVFKDPVETNPARRYKMLYVAKPDLTAATLSINAAYSPDSFHWTPEPENPVAPFADGTLCPMWDPHKGRYVAYVRFGPPNTRIMTMMQSEDFTHWAPKTTILNLTPMDAPFSTCIYQMDVLPYQGVYVGAITAYHGETIQPIPESEKAWKDKVNVQLAFSRNGATWLRVGENGAMPMSEYKKKHDWKQWTERATFIPYGRHGQDWDWGCLYNFTPLVVGDEIRIYYVGLANRHWGDYHGDKWTSGIGLATLRRDGFVSVETDGEGTLTTKPFVFIGDALEINANAQGGSVQVEALDAQGKPIAGFAKADGEALTADKIHHLWKWKGSPDCQLLQARPIQLRFYLKKAKLYSFTPHIRHTHYIPSYD